MNRLIAREFVRRNFKKIRKRDKQNRDLEFIIHSLALSLNYDGLVEDFDTFVMWAKSEYHKRCYENKLLSESQHSQGSISFA